MDDITFDFYTGLPHINMDDITFDFYTGLPHINMDDITFDFYTGLPHINMDDITFDFYTGLPHINMDDITFDFYTGLPHINMDDITFDFYTGLPHMYEVCISPILDKSSGLNTERHSLREVGESMWNLEEMEDELPLLERFNSCSFSSILPYCVCGGGEGGE